MTRGKVKMIVANVTARARTIRAAGHCRCNGCSELFVPSTQRILRFIDAGREVRGPPSVGMNFLHERRVTTRISPAAREARGLIGFLVGKFVGPQQIARRCTVSLRVYSPSGKPAVRMRCGILDTQG
jgi:hypothetical protein